jgi:hypothetical protein
VYADVGFTIIYLKERENAHLEEDLLAESQFFARELDGWPEDGIKRIYAPFDIGDALLSLLLGESVPRFRPETLGFRFCRGSWSM